jgi:hypothetical protein
MAKHRCGYVEAFNEVMAQIDDEDLLAYARREPGLREKVRDLEAEQSKLAGELLDRRAKALQKAEAIDYKTAFSMAAKRHPDLARAYGIPDPDRPAQVPWYRQPAPKWRRSA